MSNLPIAFNSGASSDPARRAGLDLGSLPSLALLAPMSGVTDVTMRRIAARSGAGLVVSEMIACDAYVRGEEEARLRAERSGIGRHVVQLAGCAAHWMAEAARLAEAAGADIIDINMGCPAKRVTGGWAGSALMRDLDHAVGLIAATVSAVKVPVTLKMRLGWDDSARNAPELARRAEGEGVRLLTVHGRTRQQFYKGRADWPAIRAVRSVTTLPLVANGDISDATEAKACLAASGADAVMVGRAALGRPWLVGQIGAALAGRTMAAPGPAEKLALALEHYEGLLGLMGRAQGTRHARKHLAAYADAVFADGLEPDPPSRVTLLTTDDPAVAKAALTRLHRTGLRRVAA